MLFQTYLNNTKTKTGNGLGDCNELVKKGFPRTEK